MRPGRVGGVRLCVSVGDCLTKQRQVALGVFAKDKSWRSLQTKVRAAIPSWSQTPAVPLPAESEELGACAPRCERRAVRIYECVLLVHVPGGTEDAGWCRPCTRLLVAGLPVMCLLYVEIIWSHCSAKIRKGKKGDSMVANIQALGDEEYFRVVL